MKRDAEDTLRAVHMDLYDILVDFEDEVPPCVTETLLNAFENACSGLGREVPGDIADMIHRYRRTT